MFLLIDNYDSFTYNLVQAFMQLGHDPLVVKNDDPGLLLLASERALSAVCISPGPGNPSSAGYCLEFLQKLPPHIPLLGVCLGHQILGRHMGAKVEVGPRIMHGKESQITHTGRGLFNGLPQNMKVGRYHSLVVKSDAQDAKISAIAWTDSGEIMGIGVNDRPWVGVQFHPESILTPLGNRLLANFPSQLGARGSDAAAITINTESIKTTPPFQMAEVMENLALGNDLSGDQAAEAFGRLMDGELTPSQAGGFLLGLRGKGETPQEVGEAVKAILARAVKLPAIQGPVIDVVGTGGDGKFSFNCSTATALILAALGHKVLKHGNRSVSSRSGSADALEQLGLPLHIPAEKVVATLERDNFVFLFAPDYHPSFKHVMQIRRELGIRTLFNFLGPLVNPARPTHHMLGVPYPRFLPLLARTLAHLEPTALGVVVCGAGGYDEVTPLGPSSMVFVEQGQTRNGRLDPHDYGITPCREVDLAISGPEDAGQVLRQLLQGKGPRAMQDMLMLNLGVALYLLNSDNKRLDNICGYDKTIMRACMAEARQAVDKGAARRFANVK